MLFSPWIFGADAISSTIFSVPGSESNRSLSSTIFVEGLSKKNISDKVHYRESPFTDLEKEIYHSCYEPSLGETTISLRSAASLCHSSMQSHNLITPSHPVSEISLVRNDFNESYPPNLLSHQFHKKDRFLAALHSGDLCHHTFDNAPDRRMKFSHGSTEISSNTAENTFLYR